MHGIVTCKQHADLRPLEGICTASWTATYQQGYRHINGTYHHALEVFVCYAALVAAAVAAAVAAGATAVADWGQAWAQLPGLVGLATAHS